MLSATCLTLNNTNLQGLVVHRNGKLYPSAVNLDEHYGNTWGEFDCRSAQYSRSGQNFRLKQTSKAVLLIGQLGDGLHKDRDAEVDLSTCIVNQQGRLTFVR